MDCDGEPLHRRTFLLTSALMAATHRRAEIDGARRDSLELAAFRYCISARELPA